MRAAGMGHSPTHLWIHDPHNKIQLRLGGMPIQTLHVQLAPIALPQVDFGKCCVVAHSEGPPCVSHFFPGRSLNAFTARFMPWARQALLCHRSESSFFLIVAYS